MYQNILYDCTEVSASKEMASAFREFVDPLLKQLFKNHNKSDLHEGKNPQGIISADRVLSSMLSFCATHKLPYNKTIFMILKFYFEIYFVTSRRDDISNRLQSIFSLFENRDGWIVSSKDAAQFESHKPAFGMQIETLPIIIYPMLLREYPFIAEIFHDIDKLRIYLLSLYLNDCYLYTITDKEIEFFDSRWLLTYSLLEKESTTNKNHWWDLAGSFYGLHKIMGDSFMQLDSLRLRNSMIETNWLKTFSEYEIEVQDLLFKKKLLEIQITLKHQNSELSFDSCIIKSKMELIEEEEQLKKLKQNSIWANFINPDSIFDFRPPNDPQIQEYRQEAEYYFRHAVKLLHPDRRAFLLDGKELSKEHEDELNKLYNEVISLHENDSLNPVDMISGDYFSSNKLKRIVSQAEMILSLIGVDLPKIKFLILGDTFESQMEFLMNEQRLLNAELAKIHAEIQILYSDNDYYQKDAILHNEDSIKTVKTKYERIIDTYKKEITTLASELEILFKESSDAKSA
ncbi:MAG: hypothetical protein V1720_22725 [bacterium]